MPCTPGLNFRPSGRKRTRFTDCDGATAVMLTGLLSASESTTRTWPPATRNPPAGPITWVTESYASGVHAIRWLPPTFCAASIGGSIPTGDGSLQLDAAALAPASSASGINHRRTQGRFMESMGGLPRHGVLREMMQHSRDVLVPLTPDLLSDPDPGRVGRGQVANDVQRVRDLRDPERIGRRHAAILEARIQQCRPSGAVGPELEAVGVKADPSHGVRRRHS